MFSLLSLDIADLGNQGVGSPALFTFFDGVRTTSRLVSLDNAKGLQTLAFGQAVQWFSFATPTSTGGSGTFQIDNLTWSAAGAVPEPASWAMMIMGFLGAGAAIRARRRTTLMPA